MPLGPDAVSTFAREGVLPLGQVLDAAQVQAAREHLAQLIAQEKVDRPSSQPGRFIFRRLNVSSFDAWFGTLVRTPAVLDAAEVALGPDVQYFQDNIFYKPAAVGGATPWHQDNIWWHSNPPAMATIWIALDDVDDDNGAVRYVRGSHDRLIEHTLPVQDPQGMTYNVLDPSRVPQDRVVSFAVPAGHAVMHHCLTIHGSPENRSPRPRRAYTVHVMRAGLLSRDEAKNPVLRGRLPAV